MSSSPASLSPSSRRNAYILLAMTVAFGSMAFTLVKLALKEISPLNLATGRVVVSALVFTTVIMRSPHRRRPIERGDRLRVLLCGFGGSAVFHLLFSWGQLHVSVAIASVIMATFPVMVAIGEVAFLHHRLSRAQVTGLALAAAGCAVIGIAGGGSHTGSTVTGMIAVMLSTLTWAGVTVATRSIAHRYDPWWLNTPGTVIGAVFIVIIDIPGLHEFASMSLKAWIAVIWLGSASSAFIYFAMARVMTVISATTTASISTVVTPTSVIVAWVILGNAPTVTEVLGGLVVIAGVVLVTQRPTADAVGLEAAVA